MKPSEKKLIENKLKNDRIDKIVGILNDNCIFLVIKVNSIFSINHHDKQ